MSASDDVLIDILLRLPAECVVRFRCVSKHWSSLTRNPNFIASHPSRSNSNDEDDDDDFSLICLRDYNNEVWCDGLDNYIISREEEGPAKLICLSGADFRVRNNVEIPSRERDYCWPELSGSCNGILCLTYCHPTDADAGIALWNPATGEVTLVPPIVLRWPPGMCNRKVSIAFGYDSKTDDYKLLRLIDYYYGSDVPCCTHLYSLATDCWKELDRHPPLSYEPFEKTYVDGAFYWNGFGVIYSFDVVDEKFHRIPIPIVPSINGLGVESLVNWKGSLGLCAYEITEEDMMEYQIWVLNTDGESWSRLLKIATTFPYQQFYNCKFYLIGQRKHGEIIFLSEGYDCGAWKIFVYDPQTQESRFLYPPLQHPGEPIRSFYSYKASLVTLKGAVELDEHRFCDMVTDPYFSFVPNPPDFAERKH